MDDHSSKSSSTVAIASVVAVIVGLAVGFGGAKLMDNNNDNKDTSSSMSMDSANSSTKASDLRANLVTLGVQHMDLTDQAVAAALDGTANASALQTKLFSNGDDIGAAVGSVYGADAQASFKTLWDLHLKDFVAYAVAGKKGDAAAKAAALADIDANYTKPIAKFLSGANPNLPEATVETAFRDHVTMTAAVIDDHNAGNYTQEMVDQQMAVDHIKGLMSTLAGAIVKQYPDKF